MTSVPTSLAIAVMCGRLERERHGGNRPHSPAGGATQSIAQSLASVAEPPLPKRMQLAAAREPLVRWRAPPRRSRSASLARHLRAQRRVVGRPSSGSTRPPRSTTSAGRLLLAGRETDRGSPAAPTSWPSSRCSKKTCTVSQSVWYRISISSWWMNGSSVAGRDGVRALRARAARTSWRPARRARRERAPHLGVALGRTEAHHHVVRAGRAPRARGRTQAERSSAGSARLPTMTGCTNSTETCCASVA